MPSTLEKLSTNRVKLTIEMPFDELKPSLDKAYKDIAAQVNVPGFRKGKVPAPIIDQRFGRGAVLQEAINDALPSAYGKAIEENTVVPLGQPDIEVTKLEDGEVVEFTAEVDVRPDFDLPDVSAISVEVPAVEVPDDDVDERIETLRQRFATNTEVERGAAKDDLVTIDLAGTRDGEALEDATASDVTYKVGSEGMLEGLDDAVIGLRAGEDATFHSTLVGGALRGEEADIKVTVTKVSEQELPEVDEEFAQLVSQFDTVEEMRADLRTSMENQARLSQVADARDNVLEALIGKTSFDLPEKVVESQIEARRTQVTQQLAQAGLTVEQYLEDSEEDIDNEDDFWAEIEKRSIDALRAQLILDKAAEDGEFEIEQDDLTQLLFQKAQANGTSPEVEAQRMMEQNLVGEWMQEIRRGKALADMVAKATVKDSDGTVLDLEHIGPDGAVIEPAEDEKPAEGPQPDTADEAADAKSSKADDEAKKSSTKAKSTKKPAAKKTTTKKSTAKKATAKKTADKKDVEKD
ncbi:MAG: trigger factor [Cutibacterium granulosum]|uniref:trigger factor n=1 Tax=Cutibacterium granulosum TaxID=33011 RepID=UPI002915AF10|nr:trigger factor [Cutibacterium granulosum]MDU3821262.1 trigger factor [Cutibacterium granulosum]MEA5648134.1 trigger factor [Cutibacterium granulosum]MEA5653395.1 trigger factor [Cutibacterium granulosum]MEA5662562.1 trigger factor [Cutibacterium granulosum]